MVAPMMIKEHMEVLGSDGVHVGTVDHLEGQDQMKLTKTDPDADGEHHLFRSHGSTTSTSTCISSNPAPRQRHAGRRTDASKRARIRSPAAVPARGALRDERRLRLRLVKGPCTSADRKARRSRNRALCGNPLCGSRFRMPSSA